MPIGHLAEGELEAFLPLMLDGAPFILSVQSSNFAQPSFEQVCRTTVPEARLRNAMSMDCPSSHVYRHKYINKVGGTNELASQ